ncbi:MAG: macrolide ABC transporter ATP-binding protein [Candidatus Lloydbacteria bacterium CG22_combo_CG10-13_8_21_14_all_47_15]|uniref:Macrolide ABC transporter ATP-binding protein n=1 Tax=Candidatus Lloydbacteria bacterium CG22_combo_CG10-13_8_21_14_all_47_15 TaxID=1974635 RepID=A0A2H0CW31_9BACT|nr:MAG: macrolide ABC transporter ATP-binding protein [Candidatus Lloydbacteria bacterium CG22_combo_CG10-13_8_21_14_all_47_15]
MRLIEARNLEKTYEDGDVATHALRGVSFSIDQGEFVAVMGPSGSGKSTLLHLLGFLDRPTRGAYFFEGKNRNDYTDDESARIRNEKLGFVFQTFNLLPRTSVLENVKLPLLYSDVPEKEWDERAHSAIADVGLSHRISHEPSQLSGGERQRVAIARALVTKPEVIFADEPTGNLDSMSGKQVMGLLQALNEKGGHTIVLITHETYTARHARRALYIKDGNIEKDEMISEHLAADSFIK